MVIKKSKFIGQDRSKRNENRGIFYSKRFDETLNPFNINLNTNKQWDFMQKFRNQGYVHKFVLQGLDFSLSITKKHESIVYTCSGLNDAKKYF